MPIRVVWLLIFFGALIVAPPCFASQESEKSPSTEILGSVQQYQLQQPADGVSSLASEYPNQTPASTIAEQLLSATEIDRSEEQTVRLSPWFGGRGSVGVAVDVTW
jgi:hypothetical protein